MTRRTAIRGLSLLTALAATLPLGGCGGDSDTQATLLAIDPDLSLQGSLGGNIGLAIDIDACGTIAGPATIEANGQTLATLATPETLVFAGGKRFLITVPASAFDTHVFGLPAKPVLVARAVCNGERAKSAPYPFTYVPTLSGLTTPAGATRFWPSDLPGELLACAGNRLVRYDSSGTEISGLDLGFTCTLAELRGDVGERRFLTVDAGGMAAIDPGPTLVWTRHSITGTADHFVFDAAWTRPDRDIVVQYRQVAGGTAMVTLVNRDTGLDASPVLPVVHKALGAVSRDDVTGDIAVLTADRTGVDNVYYIELFDIGGTALRAPVETSRYPSGTPYAEFSYDGSHLYVTADDGQQNRWIQSVRVADGTVTQLTQPSDGWHNIVGEAYFRLIVSSDDHFVWLDPTSGAPVSQPFAPDSGNAFYRLRVEPDGSAIMLADANGAASGAGFYVFAPDGTDVIRLHGGDQSYGWLAQSWEGGSLVSVTDIGLSDIQVLPTRQGFVALTQ